MGNRWGVRAILLDKCQILGALNANSTRKKIQLDSAWLGSQPEACYDDRGIVP